MVGMRTQAGEEPSSGSSPRESLKAGSRARRGLAGGTSIAATDLGFAEGDALRVEDVMQILHLSRNTVYKLAREGTLPSFRVGRQMRFRYEDIRRRLEEEANSSRPTDGASRASEGGAATEAAGGAAPADTGSGRGAGRDADQSGALPGLAPVGDVCDEVPAWARGALVVGGQDLAGDVLCNYLSGLGLKVARSHDNGYMSLARMYLGGCHAAVIDLWSEGERRYNTPFVRQMLPGTSVLVFRLFKRRVGLCVAAGNPLGFDAWPDLLRSGAVLANRERGAGSRVLLDEKLKYLEAKASSIAGYDRPVSSELAQALLVARGLANVAVTSEKPFRQVEGLGFLPMQEETVDIALLNTPQTAPLVKAVQSLLRTEAFRREFDPALYDTGLMGEIVYEC